MTLGVSGHNAVVMNTLTGPAPRPSGYDSTSMLCQDDAYSHGGVDSTTTLEQNFDYGHSASNSTTFLQGADRGYGHLQHPRRHSIYRLSQLPAPPAPPAADTDPLFEVDWNGEDDPGNPRNWPIWYKSIVIAMLSFDTWVVIFYSTSYLSGSPGMMQEFNFTSSTRAALGITTYMLGLAAGSVVLAPLSELYGRRPIYLASMFVFMLMVLPCALATSFNEILIVRFFGAFSGSALISNTPGTVTDIVDDEYRAAAFSFWSIGPLNGPVFGPLIGGFVYEYLGWRWTNWLVLIFAGAALLNLLFVRESYAPVLLQKRALAMRIRTGDARYHSRYDHKKQGVFSLLKINLSRPFLMTFTEPICIFWSLYVATIYGILYLCFVAYPIVFSEIRGWTPGIAGLGFVGMGLGACLAIVSEPLARKLINMHACDPETGKPPPEAMVSIVCIAAVLAPLGELWFAWTCAPKSIPWVWPILAGVPFGAGNTFVYIYATNYLAHSYGIYAASALAGNAVSRFILGGLLPLAGPRMYRAIGPHWAGTFLGLLEIVLIPIPFVFYKYGHLIRERSVLIRSLRKDAVKLGAGG